MEASPNYGPNPTKFCGNCGNQVDIRAEICPKCGIRIAPAPASGPVVYQPIAPVTHKSEGLAAVLSFLWCGLGQIYNGQIGKGIVMVVVYLIMLALFWLIVPLIVAFVMWIWGIYDAYKTAKKINEDAQRQAYQQAPRTY